MSACYMQEIRSAQPHGPYLLSGWSMGGLIALDVAQRLSDAGETVSLVAMFDTYLSAAGVSLQDAADNSMLRKIARRLNVPFAFFSGLPLEEQWTNIADLAGKAAGLGVTEIRRLAVACKAHLHALSLYKPGKYQGKAVLLPVAGGQSASDRRWKDICPHLHVEAAQGDHFSMLREPHVRSLAQTLDKYLRDCDERQTS